MIVSAQDIIDTVDLGKEDCLLPIYECIVNSIISLMKVSQTKKTIEVQIIRDEEKEATSLFDKTSIPIKDVVIIDNGEGFNTANFTSFSAPFSKANKKYGCKGFGRFAVLAVFRKMEIASIYFENNQWHKRVFSFDAEQEIQEKENAVLDGEHSPFTKVTLVDFFNEELKPHSAKNTEEIAKGITDHCFIYHLSGTLPEINIGEKVDGVATTMSIENMFKRQEKENEKSIEVKGESFHLYILKSDQVTSRRNNYVTFCANSRRVGAKKDLAKYDSLYTYPIRENGKNKFLDIYVVSPYFDKTVNNQRTGFKIEETRIGTSFDSDYSSPPAIDEIIQAIAREISTLYQSYAQETKRITVEKARRYISDKAPQYRSFLYRQDILEAIPPCLSDEKLDEHLHRISYEENSKIDEKIESFLALQEISEDNILDVMDSVKKRSAYDSDKLTDYVCRRKAILRLFSRMLDQKEDGKYQLESLVHNLIFPMGLTNREITYQYHNLWLLDDRFSTFRFIASDKSITSMSQIKSSKEPDILLTNPQDIVNNPVCYGNQDSGEVGTLVIFEFKRPGDTAHQKKKSDYRWEFSDLVEVYFDQFLFGTEKEKKNYRGQKITVTADTPKFGYIVMDEMPSQLIDYNKYKGWRKTPFGSYYKINPDLNLHIEAMDFQCLLKNAMERNNPFFDHLFPDNAHL